jgi:hypothetical protein
MIKTIRCIDDNWIVFLNANEFRNFLITLGYKYIKWPHSYFNIHYVIGKYKYVVVICDEDAINKSNLR